MSRGHDIFINSEARWFSAFVTMYNQTRKVFAFAMSNDDARAAIEEAFGETIVVTRSDGPMSGMPFVITESAQTTRQIWTKGIGVQV